MGSWARDWARDRQWEGGVERPVDRHGILEGGVQTSMPTSPPMGPWIRGVTYSACRQLRLGYGVVAGSGGGGVLRGGCSLLSSLVVLFTACRGGRGVPWSPTRSIVVHITGASRSDSGSESDSSNDCPPASDTVTCPFSRGERRRPMSASQSACVLPSTPICEGTCSHCTAVPCDSVSCCSWVQRSTCPTSPADSCQSWRRHFWAFPVMPWTTNKESEQMSVCLDVFLY